MRVSLSITNVSWTHGTIAERLAALARAADDAGLDTIWVADHLIQADPASDPHEPMLEAYTALGFLAGQTQHMRLGALVSPATFRAAAVLVKAVTTLDALSGGRAWLGLGSGYNEDEARSMGVPLPAVSERFDRLTDTLEVAHQMWTGDETRYVGRYEHLDHPICRPMPVRRPSVLVGGMGERRTLRLVAEHADACNLFDVPDVDRIVPHKLDVLARHCADIGRCYDDIERTITTALRPDEAAADFADRCATLGDLGIQHVVVITRGRPWEDGDIATLATAASRLAS